MTNKLTAIWGSLAPASASKSITRKVIDFFVFGNIFIVN